MTMGNERTRALVHAVEFLRELHCAADTPAEMRQRVHGILRHLPEPRAIELEAKRQFYERGRGPAAWLLPTDIYDKLDFYERSRSEFMLKHQHEPPKS